MIRWAALSPAKDHITLYLSEVIDVGSDVFQDVSEFPSLDPGEETWGKIIGSTASPEEALDLAEHELGAARDRWVNHGVIGDEYADHRSLWLVQDPRLSGEAGPGWAPAPSMMVWRRAIGTRGCGWRNCWRPSR